jgi:hypothetical protein
MSWLVLYFYEEPLLPVPLINAIGNWVLQKTKEKILVSVLKIRLNSGPVSGKTQIGISD